MEKIEIDNIVVEKLSSLVVEKDSVVIVTLEDATRIEPDAIQRLQETVRRILRGAGHDVPVMVLFDGMSIGALSALDTYAALQRFLPLKQGMVELTKFNGDKIDVNVAEIAFMENWTAQEIHGTRIALNAIESSVDSEGVTFTEPKYLGVQESRTRIKEMIGALK